MRACWLKWVGRDWSISADYIWLNYSDANNEHYDEFLIGLKRHTLAPAERNEQAMLERFSYMIDRAKQS